DRYVAIKTLRAELAGTVGGRERFRREARIAAGLSHPGILPLHAFGETGGMWYLVMGYVTGRSLAQRIHAEGRLSADETRRILRALTEALEHAHQRHVIHRDIKPANILLDADGERPLLADFGISKVLNDADALTHTGAMLGTPHYMAPEQISNAPDCDERSDVYSLGAVAYAMLTGRAPLADIPGNELLARRATSSVVPLDRLSPTSPADLSAVIMRSLANKPDDRWQNARAFRDALDKCDHLSDSTVSHSVKEISGFGAYSVAWFCFWIATLWTVGSGSRRAIVVLLALLVPMGLVLHIMRVKTPSTRLSQLMQVAFWPPLWWGMWWPAALRRPADVWKLLPWPARLIRIVMSAFTITLPVFAFGFELPVLANGNGESRWYAAVLALLLLTVGSLIATFVWSTKLNLPTSDDLLFLFGSTSPSAFWKRREIVRLLRCGDSGVREPESHVPADYLRAILELQRTREDVGASIGSPTLEIAQQIVQDIAALDHEIAALARDAPDSEVARVANRLDQLRSSSATDRPEQHRPLIDVVSAELELLREFQSRKAFATNERAKHFDKLRALWGDLSRGPITNSA
ncbi:MAG: protein kinase, partial [Gemmatimonadaceae bacterium]